MVESNNFLHANFVGGKIRELRRIKGISLTEMAKGVGVSQQQLQKYETGKNRVSIEKLIKISKLLDTSINELIGIEPNPSTRINGDSDLQKLIKYYHLINSEKLKKLLVFNSKIFADEKGSS